MCNECKVKNYNCHKNKIRANEPKIWKNNKNTEANPELSGSYKNKKCKCPSKQCYLTLHNKAFNLLAGGCK